MSRKEALSQFINQIHGRAVVVKLNSGVDYRGEYQIEEGFTSQRKFLFIITNALTQKVFSPVSMAI